MNIIKKYSGYFTFGPIPINEQNSIRKIIESQGLDLDVGGTHVEFLFEGRDLSDRIVRAFAEIAAILGDADGELRCEIEDDEEQDPRFVFYTIAGSRLWSESGRIIRSGIKQEIE